MASFAGSNVNIGADVGRAAFAFACACNGLLDCAYEMKLVKPVSISLSSGFYATPLYYYWREELRNPMLGVLIPLDGRYRFLKLGEVG